LWGIKRGKTNSKPWVTITPKGETSTPVIISGGSREQRRAIMEERIFHKLITKKKNPWFLRELELKRWGGRKI